MTLIAFQIDPIETLNPESDTSLFLMSEAQNRNYEIWVYEPKYVSYVSGQLIASCKKISMTHDSNNCYKIISEQICNLEDFDYIFIRQDPPFDMAYYSNAQMLNLISNKVTIINSPIAVLNTHEKLSALKYKEHMVKTLITRDRSNIIEFIEQNDNVVLKPLSLFGGSSVFKVNKSDDNINSYINTLLNKSIEPIIAQEFIPSVKTDDKRVFLINGKIEGALGRIPPKNSIIANIHSGGTAINSSLSQKETELCSILAKDLAESGIYFAGIDLIGGFLTEINVTSPTLMQEYYRVSGRNLAIIFWDGLVSK